MPVGVAVVQGKFGPAARLEVYGVAHLRLLVLKPEGKIDARAMFRAGHRIFDRLDGALDG